MTSLPDCRKGHAWTDFKLQAHDSSQGTATLMALSTLHFNQTPFSPLKSWYLELFHLLQPSAATRITEMLLKRGCRLLWGSNLWPFSRLYPTAWVVSQPQIHRAYHKSHFTLKWPAWRYFLELCLLPSNIKVLKILTGSYLQPPDRDSASRFLQRWFKVFPLYTHYTSNRLRLVILARTIF